MPTTPIHEIVSNRIAKKHNLDNYEFYLGSTAPDSTNVDGFAAKELRWNAHLRDKDLSIWKNNAINFYKDNKDKINIDFLKGYVTHIITDVIYDDLFYVRVINKIKNENLEGHEAHLFMLDEMDAYGLNNKEYEYVKEVLSSSNKLYSIRNINEELLNRWKNKKLNEQLPIRKVKYIDEELIKDLVEEVEKELINNEII